MRKWWRIGFAVGAVIIGVIVGFVVELGPSEPSPEVPLALREVILGMPVRIPTAETPWIPSERLTQKQRYTTTDPLALRVVSAEPAERTFQLTARLLKEDGSFQSLTPPTFSVTGGTSGYCCWYVESPGSYKLQVFREGSTPFVIPLIITASRAAPKTPLSL